MSGTERPTLAPPFDPEAFARESESRLRNGAPADSEVVPRAPPVLTPPTPRPRAALRKDAVPYLALSLSELTTRALDSKRGFLISLVDGCSPIETLLDLSGMPEEEASEILADLVAQGVLSLR